MSWDGRGFSWRLMRMMKLRGLTLSGLCKLAGIERGGKYRWLEGRSAPHAATVVLLAKALHCDPGWLLFGDRPEGRIASDQELSDRMLVARVTPPPAPRMKGDPLVWTGPVP